MRSLQGIVAGKGGVAVQVATSMYVHPEKKFAMVTDICLYCAMYGFSRRYAHDPFFFYAG
jgi:hypothetical protein